MTKIPWDYPTYSVDELVRDWSILAMLADEQMSNAYGGWRDEDDPVALDARSDIENYEHQMEGIAAELRRRGLNLHGEPLSFAPMLGGQPQRSGDEPLLGSQQNKQGG